MSDDFELVDLVFEDGSTAPVVALVTDPERQVSTERLTVHAKNLLQQTTHLVESLKGQLIDLAPDELEVTIKVGVAVESGKAVAVFANGKIDGAIEIRFTWTS